MLVSSLAKIYISPEITPFFGWQKVDIFQSPDNQSSLHPFLTLISPPPTHNNCRKHQPPAVSFVYFHPLHSARSQILVAVSSLHIVHIILYLLFLALWHYQHHIIGHSHNKVFKVRCHYQLISLRCHHAVLAVK